MTPTQEKVMSKPWLIMNIGVLRPPGMTKTELAELRVKCFAACKAVVDEWVKSRGPK